MLNSKKHIQVIEPTVIKILICASVKILRKILKETTPSNEAMPTSNGAMAVVFTLIGHERERWRRATNKRKGSHSNYEGKDYG